jgi:hypothetical protein
MSMASLNVARVARARAEQSHPAQGRSTAPSGKRSRRSSFAAARWAPSETLASPVNAALSSSATGTRLTHTRHRGEDREEINRAY